MSVDHYNTLGVISTASAADLRGAYLALARANHPDKFEGPDRVQAESRMQQINEAWNVLGVAHKRREYDANQPKGQHRRGAGSGGSGTHGASGGRRGHAHFRPFDDDPITRADIDLDATPIAGSKQIPRWVAFLPVGLFIFGLFTIVFGAFVNAAGLLALGIAVLLFSGVCFLMLPLFVMSRAERDPDL